MNQVMEGLLIVVMGAAMFVMGAVVCLGLVLIVVNTKATLTSRWRCHGSWLHARWAHRRDGGWKLATRMGYGVPSLLWNALDFPPVRAGGWPRSWSDRRALRR